MKSWAFCTCRSKARQATSSAASVPETICFRRRLSHWISRPGKRIWHQQLVHHDIWDYDPPSAPILADITVDGRRIKAVVQLTKMAFAYVFDRTNGNPVWPIEERPVPQSDVPGEKTSPTQRFPTKPPAFDRQGMSAADVIDFTPQVKEMALKAIEGFRLGTRVHATVDRRRGPKGTKGTLTFPGSGGANWEGGAFDPETGFLYVASATRTDTAVYGVTKPQPGQTDLPMIGTGEHCARRPGVADCEAAMEPHHRDRPEQRRSGVAGR